MTEKANQTTPCVRVLDQNGQTLRVIELTGTGITVGRTLTHGLVLDDAAVGRNHLRIERNGNQITVTDLGTRSGTLINGVRLPAHKKQAWSEQQPLQIG